MKLLIAILMISSSFAVFADYNDFEPTMEKYKYIPCGSEEVKETKGPYKKVVNEIDYL